MKTCVWGFGKSGRAVCRFFNFFGNKIDVIDKKCNNEHLLYYYDKIILSPGIPMKHPILRRLGNRNFYMLSEMDLALRFIDGKIIGITGTNGKTTVTNLVYNILKKSGLKPLYMGGNIGVPFINFAFKKGYFVFEISSFSLRFSNRLKPYIAVITNISPDHLDSHISFEEYIDSKIKITKNQDNKDYLVLNYDDYVLKNTYIKTDANVLYVSLENEVEGCYYRDCRFIFNHKDKYFEIEDRNISLIGEGNRINIMISIVIGAIMGVEPEVIKKVLIEFKPLPHRMEIVKGGDILWINDSKSTNPHSVLYALKSFDKKNIILIMGGKNKFLDFTFLKEEIKNKVKYLVLFGESSFYLDEIFSDFKNRILCSNVKDACYAAKRIAEKGDIVLFSPGCASFDLYNNYAERGEDFKKWVKEIS